MKSIGNRLTSIGNDQLAIGKNDNDLYKTAKLKDASDSLLTRQEAARILDVNIRTIDKWALQGDFNTYRHRGEVRFLKSEIVGVWKAMESIGK